jgi:hypothetical protein
MKILDKPNARGYNWATLFLGEINTGTRTSSLRQSQKYNQLAVPGMRCNASRKPPSRSASHEVR